MSTIKASDCNRNAKEFPGADSEMNKVGIVTLNGNFNYGNRLQLFAVSEIYEMLGFSPVNIVVKNAEPSSLADKLSAMLAWDKASDPQSLSSKARLAAFERFSGGINTETYLTIEDIPCEDFIRFSVGSDQVWNPGMIQSRKEASLIARPLLAVRDKKWRNYILRWYFLGFCERRKRIALAPSIGIDQLDDIQAALIREGVSNFDNVSVREDLAADIIEGLTGDRPAVICDPTLVLKPDDWRNVADSSLTPNGSYVLTYLLGGMGKEAKAALADLFSLKGDMELIALSDRQKPGEIDAGPAEFISLIDNACHVVTDSFHAAVFASLLNVPLTVVHREGGAAMFSRLESLAVRLGIEHVIYGASEYDLSRPVDYQRVSDTIDGLRSEFLDYVCAALRQ